MNEKIIKFLSYIPDWKTGYSFGGLDITVIGLNDPFDGNIVQLDRIYACNQDDFLNMMHLNKYNDEPEYDGYFIIGQTTSDAYLAVDADDNVVVLDFDLTYPGSENNSSQVYQTGMKLFDLGDLIDGFSNKNATKDVISDIKHEFYA